MTDVTTAARAMRRGVPLLVVLGIAAQPALAQDRLKRMPGYEQFQRVAREIPGSVKLGAVQGTWADSGRAFDYMVDGKRLRFDVATRSSTPTTAPTAAPAGMRGRMGGPERGRQFDQAVSPDSTRRAFYRDHNLWIAERRDTSGANAVAVTTDGSAATRVKNGSASWVYGEELNQSTAMWWSPKGDKLAFYRFDESGVPDYYLQLDQTRLQSRMDVEAYPKVGASNPVVELFVHDLASGKTTRVDVRDGRPFDNTVVGHYVYNVSWSPDGRALTFNRTNRRQNVMERTACDPSTGACRVVVREEWPASWVENAPAMRWLADGRRFVWASERTGFRNLYLYDAGGKLLSTLTKHPFEVASIVRVDERAGVVYYMARSGDNHMKLQLHRVGLDGKNDRRLTDPAFNHTVNVAPDGRHFVDVAQTHRTPPVTRVLDMSGRVVGELATSDLAKFEQLGLERVELFTFTAADGKTPLHGMLHFPSNFDATKKYPLLVSVYGGPATNGANESFTLPNRLTEYGFLVATIDSRSAAGRGKQFLDAIYQKLGTVEIDDQAAGVKALAARPYVDGRRVGIHGTSYGGYVSAMALMRHPDVFQAASASSPVTDWRHYDSIYSERYMWLPSENRAGFDSGSVMTYVPNLKGRLMLYYGTADNNVHPSNAMALVQTLQRAGKSFDLQVGPDLGHTAINQERMMEFFIENLVLLPATTLQ